MSDILIENLVVRYGKFEAVRGLSLAIAPGEVFGLIGPNGAGKTTTLKVLATLLKPHSGRVSVGGVDVVKKPHDVRRRIGYMPDEFGVYDDLNVEEYLHFFAAAYRVAAADRPKLVEDVLALTDLTPKIHADVDSLSRGMKQRLSIARLLLHDPAVLLLDEPMSGLDPRARIEMRELLKALREMGKTILVSSHVLPEMAEYCTRIGIFEDGRTVAEGPLRDLYAHAGLRRTVHAQFASLPPGLLDAARAWEGVAAVTELADRTSFEIDDQLLPPDELCARLHAGGARILAFQTSALDMETLFIKLTAGKPG